MKIYSLLVCLLAFGMSFTPTTTTAQNFASLQIEECHRSATGISITLVFEDGYSAADFFIFWINLNSNTSGIGMTWPSCECSEGNLIQNEFRIGVRHLVTQETQFLLADPPCCDDALCISLP